MTRHGSLMRFGARISRQWQESLRGLLPASGYGGIVKNACADTCLWGLILRIIKRLAFVPNEDEGAFCGKQAGGGNSAVGVRACVRG